MSSSSQSLSGFVKYNESVSFRDKAPGTSSVASGLRTVPVPGLILLLTWGGAPLRNIAKYTVHYVEMFPNVPILLVRTEFSHILGHTSTSQDAALEPALSIIRRCAEEDSLQNRLQTQRRRLLVHVFSNGGSYKLIEIARRYREKSGDVMPISVLYIDSAPGISTINKSVKAISYSLPRLWYIRLPEMIVVYIVLIILHLYQNLFRRDDPMSTMRRSFNEPDMIDPSSKRCYIFSSEDDLVDWRDIQDHARLARRIGYDVHEEMFSKSQHVAHAREDPKRYWQIIQDHWVSWIRT